MATICGLDVETTGLDPSKDQVTEIGAVLWDTELNAPVKFFNKLLKIDGKVPPEIVKLTGITDELLDKYGNNLDQVCNEFQSFVHGSDFVLAHNAPFDKGFLVHICQDAHDWKWIDSSTDVDYPESVSTRKLTHLAAEHGFVNPFAHRAMTDVLTMCQIVSKYDWNQTIKNALSPTIQLVAKVTFDNNQKAKERGFRWNAQTKQWLKNVKDFRLEEEIKKCADLGFLAKVIK